MESVVALSQKRMYFLNLFESFNIKRKTSSFLLNYHAYSKPVKHAIDKWVADRCRCTQRACSFVVLYAG